MAQEFNIDAFYRSSYTDAQLNYHRRMTEAFYQITMCADGLWENIYDLLPDGAVLDNYVSTFQTGGQVTCKVEQIHGYLTALTFTFRGIPIELRKHAAREQSAMYCSTQFPTEGGNNRIIYETAIDQPHLAKHYLQCMYNYKRTFHSCTIKIGSTGAKK